MSTESLDRQVRLPVQAHAPVLQLVPTSADRRSGPYLRLGKPMFDRTVAGLALLVLLPLLLVTVVVVALEFGRPVVFRQQRTGLANRPFTIYKFRTMGHDRRGIGGADMPPPSLEDRRLTHKSPHDPRHTTVGRLLRKFSLDELPQLYNVLRGDMSLVGPRPELVAVVSRYDSWQLRRHDVKPGITGLWQISARGDKPMHELTHIDLAYVDRVSLRTDLSILLRTPLALLKRSGA